jgi:WD40 repeat protein
LSVAAGAAAEIFAKLDRAESAGANMRIFLSYHSKDRPLAQALRAGLLKLEPSANVFFDQVSLESGFWIPRIFQRIAEADCFLFLIGRNGIGPWQEVEYWTALQRHIEEPGKLPLVPVIAENSEAPGLAGLRGLNWVVAPVVTDDGTLHQILTALKGDAIETTSSPLWKLVNPYRGLEAMTEAHADYFFGRHAETGDVLSCLAQKPGKCPILVGASGVGKSSVASAGVLSALKSMRWPIRGTGGGAESWPLRLQNSRGWAFLSFRPGESPVKSLVGAFTRLWSLDLTDPEQAARPRNWVHRLRDNENNLVDLIDATQAEVKKREGAAPDFIMVYLDQIEELYTYSDKAEARMFSKLLRDGLQDARFRAFASLRIDDFDLLRSDEALFDCSELTAVHPLKRDRLYEVVSTPARILQVDFEDDQLASRLTEAAEKEPGALPLLSYQLNAMWASMVKRGDATLRLPSQAIDVGGVLSSRAEDFLRANPEKEKVLRRLLTLKLATIHADGTAVRRQAMRDECATAEWDVAAKLADGGWRLVVTGVRDADGKIIAEVAHEALLHAWPRLVRWLDDERDFLVFKGDVERKEREWRTMGKSEKGLLTGHDLDRADNWTVSRQDDLSKEVLDFAHASRINEGVKKKQQIGFQRRVIAGATAALALMTVLSVALWKLWGVAEDRKVMADLHLKDAQVAETLRLAGLADQYLSLGDAATALLLALESLPDASAGIDRPALPEAELRLDRSVRSLHEISVLPVTGDIAAAAFDHDGNTIITVTRDLAVRQWDARTGVAKEGPLTAVGGSVFQDTIPAFSPGGRLAALVLDDSTVFIWDVAAHKGRKLSVPFPRHAAFSLDGKRLITASGDGVARIWALDTGNILGDPIQTQTGKGIESAEFSPDQTRIVTASWDGDARIFDVKTGHLVGNPLTGSAPGIASAAFSPDGRRIVTAAFDGTAQIWDADTGTAIGGPLKGDDKKLTGASFGAGGNVVVTASVDGSTRLWEYATGKLLKLFPGHGNPIHTAALSLDGKTIVTASGSIAQVWTIEDTSFEVRTLRHEGVVRSAMFSADGTQVLTASEDGTAVVWNADTGRSRAKHSPHDGPLFDAVFSPDSRIATASANGTAQIWNSDDRTRVLTGHRKAIWALAFSPDGKRLVTASTDKTAIVWDVDSGKPALPPLNGHTDEVRSVTFSPDGKTILTGSRDNTARLWDAGSGQPIVKQAGFGIHGGTVRSVAFSRDGGRILTASADGLVRIWDTGSGRLLTNFPASDDGSVGIHDAVYSPDEKRIVTATEDGSVRVWEVATGKQIGEIVAANSDDMWTAAYNPSGDRIVTASADETARIWQALGPQQLVNHAKAVVPRCLTPAERRTFFLAPQPPRWCIEMAKWPFQTDAWKEWLRNYDAWLQKHPAGQSPPPVPNEP